jgi:hypothetical protein
MTYLCFEGQSADLAARDRNLGRKIGRMGVKVNSAQLIFSQGFLEGLVSCEERGAVQESC